MQEGRIETVDTFANLINNNEAFQKFMASTAQEENVQEEQAVEDSVDVDKDLKKKERQQA